MTPARRRRVWAGAVLLVGVPLGLAACSSVQDGQALAQQACVHVNRSVSDWVHSQSAGMPAATVATLQQRAEQQLRLALPLAAAANSDDGTWNSLMTTISEIETVDEGHLVPALHAQCVLADSNQNVNPQNPNGNSGTAGSGNSPPTANVNPKPASG
ncbi:MAG TPA: hypothetical protein VNV83_14685 [Acidimicrobiales bacterium]|nr:hypothetical protein [Acidimicrobiales bacterium]